MKLAEAIRAYNATGRIAHHYPRLKRVSLNGGRSISERDAIIRITEHLNSDTPKS